MPARLFRTDLDRMASEVLVHRDQETGGSLFGAWSHTGQPLIYAVSGPGPGARHGVASFFPSPDHMAHLGGLLFSRAGLQHIGEWHSHHRLGLAEPSGGDIRTVWSGMEEHGLRRFVLAIANIEGPHLCPQVPVGFWLFDADTGRHTELPVEHWRGRSPIADSQRMLAETWSRRDALTMGRGRWQVRAPRPTLQKVQGTAWYAGPLVKRVLAATLRDLTAHPAVQGRPTLKPAGDTLELTATIAGTEARWTLTRGFPSVAPALRWGGVPTVEPWHAETGVVGQLDGMLAAPVRDPARDASPDRTEPPRRSASPLRAFSARLQRPRWGHARARRAYGVRHLPDPEDNR
jgi:hypothetical protein